MLASYQEQARSRTRSHTRALCMFCTTLAPLQTVIDGTVLRYHQPGPAEVQHTKRVLGDFHATPACLEGWAARILKDPVRDEVRIGLRVCQANPVMVAWVTDQSMSLGDDLVVVLSRGALEALEVTNSPVLNASTKQSLRLQGRLLNVLLRVSVLLLSQVLARQPCLVTAQQQQLLLCFLIES